MPATRRLFIGLGLPEEIATRLARQVAPTLCDEAGRAPAGLRLLPARDLHLTLAFLGAFPDGRRAALESSLAEELRGLNAPELRLRGTGGFPSLEQASVLWAGVEEEGDGRRLDALWNRVRQAAVQVGWRPPAAERGRPFRPHVTLARRRRDGPPAGRPFERLGFDHRWLPAEVALFESRPDDPRERYPVLHAVPLVVRPG